MDIAKNLTDHETCVCYATVEATVSEPRTFASACATERVLLPENALPWEIGEATDEATARAIMAAGRELGVRGYDSFHVDSGVPCRIQFLRWDAACNGSHCSSVYNHEVEVTRHRGASDAARAEQRSIEVEGAREDEERYHAEVEREIALDRWYREREALAKRAHAMLDSATNDAEREAARKILRTCI